MRPPPSRRPRLAGVAAGCLLWTAGCWTSNLDVLERTDADGGSEPDGATDGETEVAASCRPGVPTDCLPGERCDGEGCTPGTLGHCVDLPTPCPTDWAPACGCDGRTFWNDCERVRAGIALDPGETCTPASCGPGPGGVCPGGAICATLACEPGTPGTCVAPPAACGTGTAPVCGCDGLTYADVCLLGRRPVPLAHAGECITPPCAPACQDRGPDGIAWVDPCTDAVLCPADCLGCTSFCSRMGFPEEGWYAQCAEPGRDGGCGIFWNLVGLGRCGSP